VAVHDLAKAAVTSIVTGGFFSGLALLIRALTRRQMDRSQDVTRLLNAAVHHADGLDAKIADLEGHNGVLWREIWRYRQEYGPLPDSEVDLGGYAPHGPPPGARGRPPPQAPPRPGGGRRPRNPGKPDPDPGG
jgi:hypothetical protein